VLDAEHPGQLRNHVASSEVSRSCALVLEVLTDEVPNLHERRCAADAAVLGSAAPRTPEELVRELAVTADAALSAALRAVSEPSSPPAPLRLCGSLVFPSVLPPLDEGDFEAPGGPSTLLRLLTPQGLVLAWRSVFAGRARVLIFGASADVITRAVLVLARLCGKQRAPIARLHPLIPRSGAPQLAATEPPWIGGCIAMADDCARECGADVVCDVTGPTGVRGVSSEAVQRCGAWLSQSDLHFARSLTSLDVTDEFLYSAFASHTAHCGTRPASPSVTILFFLQRMKTWTPQPCFSPTRPAS
jgi:hypothetical protein